MDQLVEPVPSKQSSASAGTTDPQDDDVEEQGITRCICGMNGPSSVPSPSPPSSFTLLSTEDDAEGGEFMVQCETCNVWQHGLCMGFESEAQLAAAADYYCEQCKPERHQDLLKSVSFLCSYRQPLDPTFSRRLAKKGRESSTHSRNTTSRLSRSHSPSHLSKPPKRRNTMNSRDAAFAEDFNEVIKATAAEAAAATDPQKPGVNGCISGPSEVPDDDSNGRKKRKRGEDDGCVHPANPTSNYSSYYSVASPRSVPDRHRVPRMVLMQSLALHPKSYHHPPNAPQVENREIHAIDEGVHARSSLRITMPSFPSRVTKVCV